MVKKWVLAFVSVIAAILLLSQTAHTSDEIIVSLENPPAGNVYVVNDAPIEIGLHVELSDDLYEEPVEKGTLLCADVGDPYESNITLKEDNLIGITCYAAPDFIGTGAITFLTSPNQAGNILILKDNNLPKKMSALLQYGINEYLPDIKLLSEHTSLFSDNHGVIRIPEHAPYGPYTADCALFYKASLPCASGTCEETCALMSPQNSLAKFDINSNEPDVKSPYFSSVLLEPSTVEQGGTIQLTIEGTDDYFGIDKIEGHFDAMTTKYSGYSGKYNFQKTIPFVMSIKDGDCTIQGEYPEKTWICTKSIHIPLNAYPEEYQLDTYFGDLLFHDHFWINRWGCKNMGSNSEYCANSVPGFNSMGKLRFKVILPSWKTKLQERKILLKHWFQYPFRKF